MLACLAGLGGPRPKAAAAALAEVVHPSRVLAAVPSDLETALRRRNRL